MKHKEFFLVTLGMKEEKYLDPILVVQENILHVSFTYFLSHSFLKFSTTFTTQEFERKFVLSF